MKLGNHAEGYGLISKLFHWITAALIFGLFYLGEYMVDLDYYHPWYQKAPDLHRSLGVVVALLLVFRLSWRIFDIQPEITGKPWEQRIARWVHRSFYILIGSAAITGYLITTADGQGVYVFKQFVIPAVFYGLENQEDIAGKAHDVLTHTLFFLALLHALAALKHHFIDHDPTLMRMVGRIKP